MLATYYGPSDRDLAGPAPTLAPGGQLDLLIVLTALRAAPIGVVITLATSQWVAPPDGAHWAVAMQPPAADGSVACYFERSAVTGIVGPFGVTVRYADGTTETGMTVAPPPPPVVLAPPAILGAPYHAGDTVVNGTGIAGAVLTFMLNGVVVGPWLIAATGTWRVTLAVPLLAGDSLTATQTVAGVVSPPSAASVVVAASPPPPSPPAPPVILGTPYHAGDTFVNGTGVAGAVVTVFRNGAVAGTTTVTTAGTWDGSLSSPLVAGDILTATQAIAGVPSPTSAPTTVEAIPPPLPDPTPDPAVLARLVTVETVVSSLTFSLSVVQSHLAAIDRDLATMAQTGIDQGAALIALTGRAAALKALVLALDAWVATVKG